MGSKKKTVKAATSAPKTSGPGILKAEVWRGLALAVAAMLLWCFLMNRWGADAWHTPLEYTGDPSKSDVLSYYAAIKAGADGHYWPLLSKQVPELGAPFGAQWNDFPTTEQFLLFKSGLLAKFFGVFAAANIMTMLAHVLAALAMYAACRALRCAWPWAFAAGLAYGFSTYAFAHGVHHITVTYYWHVPLALLVCRWLTAGEGLEMRGRLFQIALGIAFVTGLQNIYYTAMFLELAALGGLAQAVRHGWRAMLPAAAVCATAIAAVLLMTLNTFVFHLFNGPNPSAVVRNYQWLEFYALKIVDLFMPFPEHRLFAGLAHDYFGHVLVPGETPPPAYLGLIGIAGLIWLAVTAFLRLVKNSRTPIPLEAAQIAWIILFSTVGGLNGLLGEFGFQLLRSTTRYSIFILALALMFLARRLSALTKAEPAGALIAAGLLALVALWDQTPPIPTDADVKQVAQAVDSDRKFTEQIEQRLPANAMVFQLPIIDFPESPVPGVSGYDHFRPYLFSTHLRYAFGSVKGRPRDDWAHDLSGLSLAQAVDALERYGFAALYVNRAGFADKGEEILKALKEMGREEMVQSPQGDLFCVFLKPSPRPVLPVRKAASLLSPNPA